MKPRRVCRLCGCGLAALAHGTRQRCLDCSNALTAIAQRAGAKVQAAIRRGDLPRADTVRCVDCGETASVYDHRDYSKPLEVEPVCRRCNLKRGPAIQGAPKFGVAA